MLPLIDYQQRADQPGNTGPQIKQTRARRFHLYGSNLRSSTVLPPHIHAHASFCLTLAGQGIEINGKVVENIRPGTLIIRPAGQIHSDRYGLTTVRTFITEVDSNWLRAFHEFSRIFEDAKYLHGGLIPALALRIYQESRLKDSAARIVVEGLMLELLGSTSRWLVKPPVRVPPWLKQTRDLLHGNFNDSLNLVAIAEVVGVHPTHLARAFKQHYRSTVGDYVRRLRLDWASKQRARVETRSPRLPSPPAFMTRVISFTPSRDLPGAHLPSSGPRLPDNAKELTR